MLIASVFDAYALPFYSMCDCNGTTPVSSDAHDVMPDRNQIDSGCLILLWIGFPFVLVGIWGLCKFLQFYHWAIQEDVRMRSDYAAPPVEVAQEWWRQAWWLILFSLFIMLALAWLYTVAAAATLEILRHRSSRRR